MAREAMQTLLGTWAGCRHRSEIYENGGILVTYGFVYRLLTVNAVSLGHAQL